MHTANIKQEKRDRRHRRVRAKVHGTALRPRLAVFKSNKYMYGQLIDDDKGVTLASVSSLTDKKLDPKALGKKLAEAAATKKIKEVVFDRGGFIYTGRVKGFAEGAREGGLTF